MPVEPNMCSIIGGNADVLSAMGVPYRWAADVIWHYLRPVYHLLAYLEGEESPRLRDWWTTAQAESRSRSEQAWDWNSFRALFDPWVQDKLNDLWAQIWALSANLGPDALLTNIEAVKERLWWNINTGQPARIDLLEQRVQQLEDQIPAWIRDPTLTPEKIRNLQWLQAEIRTIQDFAADYSMFPNTSAWWKAKWHEYLTVVTPEEEDYLRATLGSIISTIAENVRLMDEYFTEHEIDPRTLFGIWTTAAGRMETVWTRYIQLLEERILWAVEEREINERDAWGRILAIIGQGMQPEKAPPEVDLPVKPEGAPQP